MADTIDLSIDKLAGGALAEKLNIELRKLAENVKDPNTKADAVRTVTVTIKVKPDENRQFSTTEISTKSTLAPAKGIATNFIFDFTKEGKAVVKELITNDPNQLVINNGGNVATPDGKVVGLFN